MRSSLSCDFCRRSKIKCVNSGTAPCQKCHKTGNAACVLTRPAPPPPRRNHRSHVTPRDGGSETSSSRTSVVAETPRPSGHDVHEHIANLSQGVIVKAMHVFTNKFPELSLLHLPSLTDETKSQRSDDTIALLGAIFAMARGQGAILNAAWVNDMLPSESYADYTRKWLLGSIMQPPKVQVVQTLLIMTLYEWGCGNFYQSWMYCGIAIRMMQALHSQHVGPDRTTNRAGQVMAQAIETRTFWCCFIMDCMINSGTYNPPMLPMSEMSKLKVPAPLSAIEFAFGSVSTQQGLTEAESPLQAPSPRVLEAPQSFELLVSGFDVWVKVMGFIFNDGRRAPGMCAPENCPWVIDSPWSIMRSRLESWRASQHSGLHYPKNSVAIHMTLGYGESFIYINLLYYLSVLMLHREYMPFLPTAEMAPRGPIDHPMLQARAPAGWWENSSQELFQSAERIATLLYDAEDCGILFLTPFAGFCAYSACFMNLYIYRFPRMNLGRSSAAEDCLSLCLNFLEKFRQTWKIGDRWIKTIQSVSLLYQRATTHQQQYQGKSRADFEGLHHSIHEFRILDRSDRHMKEIQNAEGGGTGTGVNGNQGSAADNNGNQIPNVNPLLHNFLTEMGSVMDEEIAWSHWLPPLDTVDLSMSTI
ncbi:putative fungal-specific transcription factor [Thelonectria olida]|uniref:Fungal-specific transcription factor n=1 Tax=Thelonectria olida TaxID=1576542 RepID=A0A9P9AQB9_9HYPO|nr:putative fungal-specific transcription factor [Thelonectria olida]